MGLKFFRQITVFRTGRRESAVMDLPVPRDTPIFLGKCGQGAHRRTRCPPAAASRDRSEPCVEHPPRTPGILPPARGSARTLNRISRRKSHSVVPGTPGCDRDGGGLCRRAHGSPDRGFCPAKKAGSRSTGGPVMAGRPTASQQHRALEHETAHATPSG